MAEKLKSKLNIITFFVLFSAVWLTIMSFSVPISQTPDEYTHFNGMMNAFGTTDYIGETNGTLYEEAGLKGFNSGVFALNKDAYYKAGMKHYEHRLSINDFNLTINVVKFWPGAIGFYLGVILRLPKLVCLQMAELTSALFFIILGAITLKMAPYKKEVFLFTLLMPMTMQQCSSINPDVIVIPCSLLITAWILNMNHRDGDVTWKDVIVLGFLAFEVLIAKQIYALLVAVILIVPLSKYKLPIGKRFDLAEFIRKHKIICIVLCILLLGGFLYISRNAYYYKVLYACILEPGRTFLLMRVTLSNLKEFYEQSFVGCFGWLDLFVSNTYIIMFFVMMVFVNLFLEKDELEKFEQLKKWKRALMFVVAIAISVLVFVSMATWSFKLDGLEPNVDVATIRGYLFQITSLLGVQGRYFIPVLPMLLIPLGSGNEIKNKKTYYGAQGLFYLFTMIYVSKLVITRYWG